MNSVTLAIPGRWAGATNQILVFFQDEERLRAGLLEPFQIQLTPPLDEGQIWAFESNLNTAQALFCDAGITALNTALNAKTHEGWRVTKQVTNQAQRDVNDIESIRACCEGK